MNFSEYVKSFRCSARLLKLIVILSLFLSVVAMSNWLRSAAADNDPEAAYRPFMVKYRRPSDVPYPKDNQFTKERELLGRTLFFDPRLSESNWIS